MDQEKHAYYVYQLPSMPITIPTALRAVLKRYKDLEGSTNAVEVLENVLDQVKRQDERNGWNA